VYLGDDVTDEDAFRALRDRGIGIFVGEPGDLDRSTAATFTLRSPDEVGRFLNALAR
jgi:trehalose 6-phosphate phosphatase